MSAVSIGIPYQKQSTEQSRRTCGAACLSMVYGSLGKEVPQEEIWPVISKTSRLGSLASTTYLMAQDALNRGFRSVVIQARHPLQALRQCREFGLSAILNHRLRPGSAAGHYSVLVDIDAETVVLHDPQLGPARRLSHLELLELWVPLAANSEITGNVLIAIAPGGGPPASVATCPCCNSSIFSDVECPKCKTRVGLRPRAVLGCVNHSCLKRLWDQICCPACDHLWDFSQPSGRAPAASAGADLPKIFAALDKFTALLAAIPAAANHPELSKQLEFMANSKEKLKAAATHEAARRALVQGQLADLKRTMGQKREEQYRKMEESKKPMPPLDGNELGWALVRNLGLRN